MDTEGAGFPAGPPGSWRGRRGRDGCKDCERGWVGVSRCGWLGVGTVGGRRVTCRCPPSATMPGIDKLPIEETLEDSPQVRRGRRREAREGAAWADPEPDVAGAAGARPRPGGRRRPVPPPSAGRAQSHPGRAARPQPAWACAARPGAARGVWQLCGPAVTYVRGASFC